MEFVEDDRRDFPSFGSWSNCRSSTPSVTKRILVRSDTTLSNRIWYPTSSPSALRLSLATRAASIRVASRRGWRTTTSPHPQQPVVQQHLRHLRRFARTCGRLEDQPVVRPQRRDERMLEFEDRQLIWLMALKSKLEF